MKRIYEPAAYGPQGACYWADTVEPASWGALTEDLQTDVAIIGGGFTGVSAAYHLAQAGIQTTVLEAEHSGYGASGRNGGFCCLGGAKASRASLAHRFGKDGLAEWRQTEVAAVDLVGSLIDQLALDVDRHSQGETLLAHSAKAWSSMQSEAATAAEDYDVSPILTPQHALRQDGLGGPWHGAMTIPIGFGLNPRKYHSGLAQAAIGEGAQLFDFSPVESLDRFGDNWRLRTPKGTITAQRVILATNGYSSEDLPDWLRARYLPTQSSVIVTRPLTDAELDAAGWHSNQMAYDSRTLLHYFRLMPNRRFLFGMRGGLKASARANTRIEAQIRKDFARLFPAWSAVEITHSWQGLVCLMAGLTPFVGPVPGHNGLFAGLGFHGNGVAMGTYAGKLLASLAQNEAPRSNYPAAMKAVPKRFPLGRHRRALLWPAYAMASAFDL
ncbi:NAD(P)/FAD-dependent oxidoreductase [Thalassococcus lentus]|uniref:FAD-dependent oxidoreductase n=1 Tax=Thalassococcus lentus TaxID=1210524 RepID=A0ABT4XNR6_9RHOB|nr:FAD-dependent oxidoreductase [Thalassococcus lentus]MDA7423594.1 FAD-dependent oxidoreductase [Thalassococcus lentus]